ncbi:hypothetical protein NQ318_021197 [Aromia moschata]|uniref:Uncharacterized protein n=1 Tax=Aromia moschata TaxID=1265417 RepID=A0AAV8YF38_9CUCU|nr:hypothetical protein NQ318_021197 [Aromia moschata]
MTYIFNVQVMNEETYAMDENCDVNCPSIDEILNKLSTKFNRIFYDREFVCCVNEDFQVVLKNKNKCCVVVFPVLGPSYLKAVRYQAKIFDLAVFTLGSSKTRSIAVCQKEFLKKKTSELSDTVLETKLPLVRNYCCEVTEHYDSSNFRTFNVLWNKSQYSFSETDVVVDLSVINCGHSFVINKNEEYYLYNCKEDHSILECYWDKKTNEILDSQNSKQRIKENGTGLIKSSGVIVLEPELKIEAVEKNNVKNSNSNLSVPANNVIQNSNGGNKIIQSPKKSNEHEQEKEIMRKTKEHINRKTRPIIKYVDDINNTLKIDKCDDVNNWEDLFDDNGQLQEELFKEITHKVGTDVTILKAKEDYSDYSEYVTKQSEELEHMVELYDFPSTLETHDIIQAFSDINSDAMYVKWVDDTHAILVLGSLKQGITQRAMEIDSPLIKVRPMTAASGMSLATAYKHDLRPAMKRPQTNLQTARRLITTHLGTKSKISREQTTKERNDLKAAREMKKLLKKNEHDAWEGNLRSSAS